jgi:hypothetical protein
MYVKGFFIAISGPSTSLLFLFRVRAVYNNSKMITALFGILWLATTGLNILFILGESVGTYIGYLGYIAY